MLRFGQGRYILPYIRDNDGNTYAHGELHDHAVMDILSQPPTHITADHLVKSILHRAMLSFQCERDDEQKLLQGLKLIKKTERLPLKATLVNGEKYYHIHLAQHDLKPGVRYDLRDAEDSKIRVGHLIAVQDKITTKPAINIIVDKTIILSGCIPLASLNIKSQRLVCFNQDYTVDDTLYVLAESLYMPDNNAIQATQVIFHCENKYDIRGKLTADHVEIQAGLYQGQGCIVADTVFILSEEAHLSSSLKAKNSMILMALDWTNTQTAHLHAPNGLSILCEQFDDRSFTSAAKASYMFLNGLLGGTYYLDGGSLINSEFLFHLLPEALFVCNGLVCQRSEGTAKLDGKLIYSHSTEVTWSNVVGPVLQDNRFPPNDTKNNFTHYEIFDENFFDVFPKKSAVNISAGLRVDATGLIKINRADLAIESDRLLTLVGQILQSRTGQAHSIRIKSDILKMSKGSVDGNQLTLEANKQIEQANRISAKNIYLKAEDYTLSPQGKLFGETVNIVAANDVEFMKGAEIEVGGTLSIKAKRIINRANIHSRHLYAEAKLYILNRGTFTNDTQYFIAPIVFSTGGLSANRTTVNSYLTMIMGFNSIGSFTNVSIANLSPGLSIQSIIMPPTPAAAFLSVANAAFTVASALCPVAAAPLNLARYVMNTMTQGVSTFAQIHQARQSMQGSGQLPEDLSTMKIVTAISQAIMCVGYTVNSAVMNGHSMMDSMAASQPRATPELLPLTESVAANMLSMFNGYNNYSLVSMNPSFVGFGSTNYSLVNMNAGAILGLSSVNNAFYNVDAGYSMVAGPSSSTGYANYVIGNSSSLMGQNIINYHNVVMNPAIAALPMMHTAVIAHSVTLEQAMAFYQSTITTHQFHAHHDVNLLHANLVADAIHVDRSHTLHIDHGQVTAQTMAVESGAEVQAEHASLMIGQLNDQGAVNLNDTHAKITHADVSGQLNANEASLVIDTATVSGSVTLNESTATITSATVEAELKAENHSAVSVNELNNHGAVTVNDSSLTTTNLVNAGTMTANHGAVSAETLHNQGTLTLDDSALKASECVNDGTLTANQSSVVMTTLENHEHGAVALTSSLVDITHLGTALTANKGTILIQGSKAVIQDAHNQGGIQLIDANAQIDSMDNQGGGLLAVDGSTVHMHDMKNEAGGTTAFRSSSADIESLDNAGQFSADDSYLRLVQVNNRGLFHTDHSLLETKSFIGTDAAHFFSSNTLNYLIDPAQTSLGQSPFNYHRAATQDEIAAFTKTMPVLYYSADGIYYKSDRDMTFSGRTIDALKPVTYIVPNATISGGLRANTQFTLMTTGNLTFDHASVYAKQNTQFVSSQHIFVNDSTIEGEKDLVLNAEKNVQLRSSLVASNELYVHSHEGDISLLASQAIGKNYTEIVAEQGSVNLNALTHTVRGRYDTLLTWQGSGIYGGAGDGHEGNGVFIYAGKDINVSASSIGSVGNNLLYAKGNITIKPETHQYISNRQEKSGFLGFSKREIITTKYQVQKSDVTSTQGRNILVAENGDATLTAANLMSRNGNDIYAGRHAQLLDIVTNQRTVTYKEKYWGASSTTIDERTQSSVPTVVANYDPGVTRIHAGGDVYSRGTVFYCPGKTEIDANNITLTASRLDNSTTVRESGISASLFGQQILGQATNASYNLPADPTYQRANYLLNSGSGAEAAINGVSTFSNAVNSYYDAQEALKTGQFYSAAAQRYGLPIPTEPNGSLTWYNRVSKCYYQSTATGGLVTDELSLHAKESITLTDVPVEVKDAATLAARHITINEMPLDTVQRHESTSVTVSASNEGVGQVSTSHHADKSITHGGEGALFKVGGTLNIDADDMTVSGARVEAKHLAGRIDHLSIIAPLHTQESSSKDMSLSTGGQLTYQSDHSKDAAPTEAYIHVQDGLQKDLKLGKVDLTDATLTDQDDLPDLIEEHTQASYHEHSHHGVIADTADTAKCWNHLTQPKPMSELERVERVLDAKTADDVAETLDDAYALSNDVYLDDAHSPGEINGFRRVDEYDDPATGMRAAVYVNEEKKEVYIAFNGTDGLTRARTDDIDILSTGMPRSSQSNDYNQFMDSEVASYRQEGYNVHFTGHSAGATEASLASAKYHAPAVVFDNPGVAQSNHCDMSQVVSFQSIPNAVNRIPEINGQPYDRGTTVNLPMTTRDQASYAAATAVGMFAPASRLVTVPALSVQAHSLDEIGPRVDAWKVANH